MCGILLLAREDEAISSAARELEDEIFKHLAKAIDLRGPDGFSACDYNLPQDLDASPRTQVKLVNSVLCLRGAGLTEQPFRSSDGRFYLSWNGQVFHWNLPETKQEDQSWKISDFNDGKFLFDVLMKRISKSDADEEKIGEIFSQVLSQIEGPYATVLLDLQTCKVFFARDPIGRRSLLVKWPKAEHSSLLLTSVACPESLKDGKGFQELDCEGVWSMNLRNLTETPVKVNRTSNLTSRLVLPEHIDPEATQSLDPSSSDREAAAKEFLEVLLESVSQRVANIDSTLPESVVRWNEPRVAVLFSGGLDCSTLSLLAHRFISPSQPIDLLNVAFENPRALGAFKEPSTGDDSESNSPPVSAMYEVPDRLTGLKTWEELKSLVPERQWNFIEVNVPYKEFLEQKENIEALMHPCDSVMDLSIAAALWFASRGIGQIAGSDGQTYRTPAPVLISGLGADELLGGYARHRGAFQKYGMPALVRELQLDLDRLPTRNLGRDDRIYSSHGREARFPFLSRGVVAHLASLPVQLKLDISLGEGVGDKLLLRDLAKKEGLHGAAGEKKRAIQFGARSAKMEKNTGKIKGQEKLQK